MVDTILFLLYKIIVNENKKKVKFCCDLFLINKINIIKNYEEIVIEFVITANKCINKIKQKSQ